MRGVILLLIILLSIMAVSAELKPAGFLQSEFDEDGNKNEDGTPGVKLNGAKSMQIVGNYAYIILHQGIIQVIDISNPLDLKPVDYVENGISGIILDWSSQFLIDEHYLYVISREKGVFQVIDISDPTNLKSADFIQSERYFEGDKLNEDGTPGLLMARPSDFQISNDYAYVLGQVYDTLQAIDITDPYNLKPAGNIKSSFLNKEFTLEDPNGIEIDGHYAYVINQEDHSLQVFDISDPVI